MPTVPEFVAASTEKVAKDLLKAVETLSDERRVWQPMGKGRSAANQLAECAILNLHTARLITERKWQVNDYEAFFHERNALADDWDRLRETFLTNLPLLLDTLRKLPEDQLSEQVETPFGMMTLSEIISYPLWNMSYHEGQVNYLTMLGDD